MFFCDLKMFLKTSLDKNEMILVRLVNAVYATGTNLNMRHIKLSIICALHFSRWCHIKISRLTHPYGMFLIQNDILKMYNFIKVWQSYKTNPMASMSLNFICKEL